ncbi:septal ring lytic transglycosylase RlpA family protein [Sphingosinithalassobacter sp. CS137]|uniref:septal ring lytic transglycosylase RlpA family protein n=1 Tax=Sphingosinithalassobacter sp. CS137 TaxID=2762748 RepID=UPI00165D8D92|nr:septal ring lytic transglycosylase RlpA family protein [Sphingosinithalassobacter sp. CS137]
MTEAHTLPTRSDRLRAFVRLKLENRWLRLGLIAALVATALLSVSLATVPEPRERIALGKGLAGVDSELAAFETAEPSPLPSATRDVVDHTFRNASRIVGLGEASYYGDAFAGRSTASGEIFDPALMTAAHRTLPLGSRVRVTEPNSGRSVVVRINDRGPYHGRRVIDLSEAAARELGMLQRGTARVQLALLLA